ncbi:NlpC/P60 family protein [Virgibacillus sp. JSM 102003]|uniref:C40 family peptidase n=1 Tax=Virgibacillus sp. JSM 102003 TaxID=1562108 RepID=UPI0035BEC465
MKKTISIIATTGVVILGSTFLTDSVYAETPNNSQSERSTINANLSKAEEKIADVMIELEDLNEKIDSVNSALEQNKNKMNETADKIKDTKNEIETIEHEVNDLEEDIKVRNEILKDRIVSYQKNGGDVNYLEVIFGSKSFSDLIGRVSAVTKIAESDNKLMQQQKEDKAVLEEKRESAEKKLDELKEMKKELEGMKDTILAQKEQNEAVKKKLKEKEQNLRALKSNLQDKKRSLVTINREVDQRSGNVHSSSESSSSSNGGDLTTLSKREEKVPSGSLSEVMNAGMPYLGTPYVWGGGSPSGFDCSGFISWAFAQAGISVPSSTAQLQYTGTKVSYSNIQPGDLVFFNTYKTNGHVGIYLGNGKFIGSQNSTGLAIASMNNSYWKSHFAGHVRRVR